MNLTSILGLKLQSVCFSSVCQSYMICCWSNLFLFLSRQKSVQSMFWSSEAGSGGSQKWSVEASKMRKDVRFWGSRSGGMLWNVVKQVTAYGRNVSFCDRDTFVCLGVCWSVEFLLSLSFHYTSHFTIPLSVSVSISLVTQVFVQQCRVWWGRQRSWCGVLKRYRCCWFKLWDDLKTVGEVVWMLHGKVQGVFGPCWMFCHIS